MKQALGFNLTVTIDCFFQLVVGNGFVSVTLSRPEGYVLGISYNGIDNILEAENEGQDRGYVPTSYMKNNQIKSCAFT